MSCGFFSKKVHYTQSFYDAVDGLISLDFLHKKGRKILPLPNTKKIKFIYITARRGIELS